MVVLGVDFVAFASRLFGGCSGMDMRALRG